MIVHIFKDKHKVVGDIHFLNLLVSICMGKSMRMQRVNMYGKIHPNAELI